MNNIDFDYDEMATGAPQKPAINAGNLLIKDKYITSIFWKIIVFMFASLVIGVVTYSVMNASVFTIAISSITFVFFLIVMHMRLKKE